MTRSTAAPRYLFGLGYEAGSVLVGIGLHNAGRSYTVLALGAGNRIRLRSHLTGRSFWTDDRSFRVHA